ncbi:MAG: OmpA family protein [Prevotellaceae bacterium]|jgi:chemotaxis protein MotB|nr:OmpA family protein [Prevotellaceae bacterium]
MKQYFLLVAFFSSLIFSSCISPKQLQDAQDKQRICAESALQLNVEMEGVKMQNQKMRTENAAQDDRIAQLQDTIVLLQDELQSLNNRYANLMKMLETAQKGSQKEMRTLLEQIQQNQSTLQAKEDELYKMERTVNERGAAVQQLSQDLDERNAKLIALERALHQKDSVTNALKKKLSDALLNFEGKGLTVKIRDGKVYVSMEDKLLFASGSSEVDARGAEAIKSITGVLEKNPDINVVIEGHTDDVPYKGAGQLLDNWDLSCKRATSVVRLMLGGSTIEESRITAAGRSEYLPISRAKTQEARQANRRIEVILTPKIDEILKMLQ